MKLESMSFSPDKAEDKIMDLHYHIVKHMVKVLLVDYHDAEDHWCKELRASFRRCYHYALSVKTKRGQLSFDRLRTALVCRSLHGEIREILGETKIQDLIPSNYATLSDFTRLANEFSMLIEQRLLYIAHQIDQKRDDFTFVTPRWIRTGRYRS